MPRRNNRIKRKKTSQYYNERRLDKLKKEIIRNQILEDTDKDTDLATTKKDQE